MVIMSEAEMQALSTDELFKNMRALMAKMMAQMEADAKAKADADLPPTPIDELAPKIKKVEYNSAHLKL